MDRIRLFLLLILFPIMIFGQQRSIDEARALAEQFVESWESECSTLSPITFPIDSLNAFAKHLRGKKERIDATNTPFHVFNDTLNNHFVIVSGDERMNTVLGYAKNGIFEYSSIPYAMKQMMEQYAEEYEYLQTSTSDVKEESSNITYYPIAPLLLTTWNQVYPYNKQTPYINGKQAYTGCVATAMAQIMNYYEYPTIGIGQHSYISGGEEVSQDFSATTFYWDSMRDDYKGEFSEEEADAVSTLMRCCGVAINTNYEVAGAFGHDIPYALRTYFGYNDNTVYYERNYFSDEEWHEIILEELSAGRPILYSGIGSGGHAFVLDGCDANGLYHINWGWGGSYDGYFSLSALKPTGGNDYTFEQQMVCHIAPETFGEEESVFFANSFLPSANVVQENSTARLELFGCLCYSNRTSYSQDVKENWTISLALYNEQFELIKILDSYSTTLAGNRSCGKIDFRFIPAEANLTEGETYFIGPVVCRAGNEKYTRIRTLKNTTDYCEVHLCDGKLQIFRMGIFEKDGVRYQVLEDDPNSVKVIGYFSDESSVIMPERVAHRDVEYTVVAFETKVFSKSNKIKSVELPATIRNIEEKAFYGCSNLTSVTIPYGVTSIGDEAFYSCTSLASITIPNSVTSIGELAFAHCRNLTSVTISDKVTCIKNKTFFSCISLTSVTIPYGITSIEEFGFSNCISLTSITIPNSVTNIKEGVFRGCYGMTSVTISDNVTDIGNVAFKDCKKITSIVIPHNIKNIGLGAFVGCTSLRSIYALPTIAPPNNNEPYLLFSDLIYDQAILYIPKRCEHSYSTTNPWKQFRNMQTIETGMDYTLIDDKNTEETLIYNIKGIKLQDTNNLPSGLYIKYGKKFYVK